MSVKCVMHSPSLVPLNMLIIDSESVRRWAGCREFSGQ